MLTQHNPDDIPPPYTPGRAPPSYPNPEDAAQESLDVTHAAQALAVPAPAALGITTRVPYTALPVLSPYTTYDSSRLPFKFITRPSPAYIPSATSHMYVAVPEPDLITEPVVGSSADIAATASRTVVKRKRPTGCCGCICSFVFIVLLITAVALLDKKAHDSAAKHPKKYADAPKVNHAEPSCSFLIFC
ncbi:hypothetical protein HBI04_087900 [Parastagonospora nodorum]|nr:hypothetical protein HBH43_069240 [Parastagonospora nodorum]KAH4270400.1 hypothetical protein HBI03_040520 [Parastagonospora nodorum]KAH4277971.1 hypothetical protein HBI04_087900 [Parastagonospora nodorum]KAH4610580.1 hypothetical protein HBH82_047500 [Parastagonospora nodorum]KAH4683206.1 hypothetical protein HBH78_123860 [Parastagonospora nodorum]